MRSLLPRVPPPYSSKKLFEFVQISRPTWPRARVVPTRAPPWLRHWLYLTKMVDFIAKQRWSHVTHGTRCVNCAVNRVKWWMYGEWCIFTRSRCDSRVRCIGWPWTQATRCTPRAEPCRVASLQTHDTLDSTTHTHTHTLWHTHSVTHLSSVYNTPRWTARPIDHRVVHTCSRKPSVTIVVDYWLHLVTFTVVARWCKYRPCR